jgi:ATP-dependent helicase/nuclease subunit A
MSEKLGEIEYDEDAMLYQGMAFENAQMPSFDINVLSKKTVEIEANFGAEAHMGADTHKNTESNAYYEMEDELEADEILKTEEFEANAIANAIKKRIGTSVYDPKAQVFKPCTYRDIVVLLRSSKSWTPTFEQVFLEAGIPLFADSSTGYFDTLEIKMVMALLKIIDNPLQDLALMTVLRSPMVGLSIEELVTIKAVTSEKTYFYLKCLAYLEIEDTSDALLLKEKLGRFIELYSDLCSKALYMPLDELVWSAIQKSGFYYYVSAMPGGVSRQANLKLLVDRATALKSSRIVTLGHFIEFVDKMGSNSGDFGVANVISEEDNVVRLMSIHKSKGLEFPVVMIGGLGRKFNFMDAQGDLIQHKRLGMGLSAVDLTLRTKSKTLPQFVIRDQIRRETLSEEMRVLYVGLTRPVDQIVLFATVADYERKMKQWLRGVDHLSLLSASGFIDWIMPALLGVEGVTINVQDPETLAIGALRTETIEVAQVKNWKAILESPHVTTEKNALYAAVDARLSFKNQTETGLFKPLKVSVSEKKNETVSDDIGFKAPSLYEAPQFMKKALPITAAEIGTAMHTILEKIDINMQPEHQVLSNYIETLVSKRFLTEAEVSHIDHTKILKYLNSNLAQRIRMAQAVYRETPFVLKMEDQYVQGIIDLYLEESDGLILVDYKTDRIGRESVVEIAERYRGQLTIYEQALTRLTGKRVKEKAIYFLDNDTLYPM